jgi:hypothetical protein
MLVIYKYRGKMEHKIQPFLTKVLPILRIYLKSVLSKIYDNWWSEGVLKKLSKEQAEYIIREKINSLDGLDLAKLLRVFDENWNEISRKMDLASDARTFIKEMKSIRNKLAHSTGSNFYRDEIFRDLDTLQRLATIINAANAFIEEIQIVKNGLFKAADTKMNETVRIPQIESIDTYERISHKIGPYSKEKILFCSADASPESQRTTLCDAGSFFPGAKWVGAIRNSANRLSCRFSILTTAHGMVNDEDIISPYDMHIDRHMNEIGEIWNRTIANLICKKGFEIIVIYFGGCPRDSYLKLLVPILKEMKIDILTYGKPNNADVGKTVDIVHSIIVGTTSDEIKSLLKYPYRFMFYCHR